MSSNLAKKRITNQQPAQIRLVDQMEIKNRDDRHWFQEFLNSIFSSPDLDYSQFEYLESKRTRQQMERGIY